MFFIQQAPFGPSAASETTQRNTKKTNGPHKPQASRFTAPEAPPTRFADLCAAAELVLRVVLIDLARAEPLEENSTNKGSPHHPHHHPNMEEIGRELHHPPAAQQGTGRFGFLETNIFCFWSFRRPKVSEPLPFFGSFLELPFSWPSEANRSSFGGGGDHPPLFMYL